MNIGDHKKVSGLSGNEIYCLDKVGFRPGQLCVGNSVVAIGILGGLGAGLSTLGGGEVAEITRLVHEGRSNAFRRMMEEGERYGGVGITGVSFDMINHGGNVEFITVGSTIHQSRDPETLSFSTSADAQQLYCQLDAGFQPLHFVFGNVAYSIGLGGNVAGAFRQLARGEVPQYSEIFDKTRRIALGRIVEDARRYRANAVIGIETTISPLMGAQEMIMVGTASHHPLLTGYAGNPVTSDMTNEEMWNMASLGYLPIKLVMGVSVYSLGLAGGILSALKSLGGGEVGPLTDLLYEAREKALARIEQDADECGADEVIGVKTRVYDLGGGLVEFMAIGTAVKKIPGVATRTEQLIPQAIIKDQDTFIDVADGGVVNSTNRRAASASVMQRGPVQLILFGMVALYFFLNMIFSGR